MTIFTYITGITLGSMIGDMVIHGGVEFLEETAGVILWSIFIFIVEYAGLKTPFIRVVLDSEPTIVIKRGEIQVKELRKMRLNMDDLTMLLHEKDVFTVRDVWYAILEPHGELSIVKQATKQPVSMESMGLKPQNPSYLPGELITDGKLITKNLLEFGKTKAWLTQELGKIIAGETGITVVNGKVNVAANAVIPDGVTAKVVATATDGIEHLQCILYQKHTR